MILYQHSYGALINRPYTLEEMFAYSVRFQVFVENQEEYDLLSAYQLMFGRELKIDIFSDWVKTHGPQEIDIGGSTFIHAGESILPITFTTFSHTDLRGYI